MSKNNSPIDVTNLKISIGRYNTRFKQMFVLVWVTFMLTAFFLGYWGYLLYLNPNSFSPYILGLASTGIIIVFLLYVLSFTWECFTGDYAAFKRLTQQSESENENLEPYYLIKPSLKFSVLWR